MFLFGNNEIWECPGEIMPIRTASCSRKELWTLLGKLGEIFKEDNDEIKIVLEQINLIWQQCLGRCSRRSTDLHVG